MIPDEAVEAAAKAIHEAGDWDEPWTGADWRADCARNEARAALEAAAPYLSEAAKQPQRTSPTDWPDVPRLP